MRTFRFYIALTVFANLSYANGSDDSIAATTKRPSTNAARSAAIRARVVGPAAGRR
jgi:hypothetical protein